MTHWLGNLKQFTCFLQYTNLYYLYCIENIRIINTFDLRIMLANADSRAAVRAVDIAFLFPFRELIVFRFWK